VVMAFLGCSSLREENEEGGGRGSCSSLPSRARSGFPRFLFLPLCGGENEERA